MASVEKAYLIGVHYDTNKFKNVVGFKILCYPGWRVLDFSVGKLKAILDTGFAISGIKLENKVMKGSNGSIDRYSRFVNNKLQGKESIVVIGKVGESGFDVWYGDKMCALSEADLVKALNNYGLNIANGRIHKGAYGLSVASINGNYEDSPRKDQLSIKKPAPNISEEPKKEFNRLAETSSVVNKVVEKSGNEGTTPSITQQQQIKKEDTPRKRIFNPYRPLDVSGLGDEDEEIEENAYGRPVVRGTELKGEDAKGNKIFNDGNGHVVDADAKGISKMAFDDSMSFAIRNLRSILPFFYAALRVIPRIEVSPSECSTVCVSPNKMYYNAEFLNELSVSKLTFVLAHEIDHIMMRHHSRGRGKDPELWNIVTDLYINADLCNVFGIDIKRNQSSVRIPVKDNTKTIDIAVPEGLLLSPDVDVYKDTPEEMYNELLKKINEAKKNQQSQQANNQGQGQGGNGQGQGQGQQGNSQGQNQQGQQGQGASQDQGRQNQKGFGQGQGNGNQSQKSDGAQSGNGQRNQGGQGSGSSQENDKWPGSGQADSSVSVQYRGVTVVVDGNKKKCDIVEDNESKDRSSTDAEQREVSTLGKIQTAYDQYMSSPSSTGHGAGKKSVAEQYVAQELIPKVNWRDLVRNRLMAKITDERSLSNPDRRFVHRGLYVEGNVKEEERLEGIKLCIDTSGSMSIKDIAIAIGQIMQLCKQFDTQAELVYWDDEVQEIIEFDKLQEVDLKKWRAKGRGGTDPNCVFREFSKKEYKTGRKVAPSLIVLFTDGYFDMPDIKYKTKFGKDTVWVLCSETSVDIERFNPPFGRKAKLTKRK